MSIDSTGTPQQPPSGAVARPPPPRPPRRTRLLMGVVSLGVLVAAAALLVASGRLHRSVATTTTVDGAVDQVVVDGTAGDLHVSVADRAPHVRVTEHRPLWTAATHTVNLDDGVLRLSGDCSSWLLRCSVDHHVELPAGVDVQVRATAGEVRLVEVGDVDVELVTGGITVEDATGASFVTRTR